MDVGLALNEIKASQDKARNLKDQTVLIFKTYKSIYKNSKHAKSSANNLSSIYRILLKELEWSPPQTSGNVVDHTCPK